MFRANSGVAPVVADIVDKRQRLAARRVAGVVATIALSLSSLVACGRSIAGLDVVRIANASLEQYVAEVLSSRIAPGAPEGVRVVRYYQLAPGDSKVVGAVGHVVNTVISFSIRDAGCDIAFEGPQDNFGNPSGDYRITPEKHLLVLVAPLVLDANSYPEEPWAISCEAALPVAEQDVPTRA